MKSMKVTVLVGVTLTMLMMLLVLIAAFIFLFQGRETLAAHNGQLQQAVDRAEARVETARATRDAQAAQLATAEAEAVLLEGQLVGSQQEANTLSQQLAEIGATLETVQQEAQVRLQATPQVTVVRPQPESLLLAGEPVDIVVAAADANGVTSVKVTVSEELIGNYVVSELPLVTITESWTPPHGGQYEMIVEASNGRIDTVITTTLSVIAPISPLSTLTADPNSLLRAQIAANVSVVRGLQPLTPITTTVLTTAELAQRLMVTPTVAALNQEALAWQAFDLIAPEFDYVTFAQMQTTDRLLSYYDAETKEMVVAGDAPPLSPEQQLAYAREVMRLLLHQHFGFDEAANGRFPDDAQLAAAAFAAGDVALTQNLYLRRNFFSESELNTLLAALGERETAVSDDGPAIFQQLDAFRQETGLAFVQALYQQNEDFTAVDAAWDELPLSTEQLLHPDRYEERDAPRPAAIPAAIPADEWTLIAEGTLGEFLLRAHLSQQLNPDQVETAAAGWGGDRYALYRREADGARLLVWRLLWDTLNDSIQFAALYPNYPTRLLDVSGDIQPDGSECWQGNETICLMQQNDQTIVVRAPQLATATAVLSEINSP